MSPLKEIPLENLDLEPVTLWKDFVQPLFFPYQTAWKGQRILYVGEPGKGKPILEKQFPGAEVQEKETGDFISTGCSREPETFDYIAAAGIKNAAGDMGRELSRLISLLKPGGIMAACVYGYAGYYGLEMLASIIKHISSDIENISAGKNLAKLKRITAAVLEQLPKDHPAYHRKAFMERLGRGEPSALGELVNLSADKIFTVSRLMESIEQGGGRFLDWVIPGFYDPARYVEEPEVAGRLGKLREPQRWEVAEMVNAAPPVHYFFLGRKDNQPVNVARESNDLYLWRPVCLPLYQWESLSKTASGGEILNPVQECEGIGGVELRSWEVELSRASTGTMNLDRLSVRVKKSAEEVRGFLKRAVEGRLLALLPPC